MRQIIETAPITDHPTLANTTPYEIGNELRERGLYDSLAAEGYVFVEAFEGRRQAIAEFRNGNGDIRRYGLHLY